MKRASVLITSCVLLSSATYVAHAQQVLQSMGAARPTTAYSGNPMATDRVISDSMVLPLIGLSDHIEGRLAFLKTELEITPAQLSAWNAFAAAIRVNAKQESDMLSQQFSNTYANVSPPGLPQRLKDHEMQLVAHLNMLRAVSSALLPLYASLSEAQRKTAEALSNSPMSL